MNNVVLECKDCGTILVINAKDLWHYIKCTHCGSSNVVNLDEEFDQVESRFSNLEIQLNT